MIGRFVGGPQKPEFVVVAKKSVWLRRSSQLFENLRLALRLVSFNLSIVFTFEIYGLLRVGRTSSSLISTYGISRNTAGMPFPSLMQHQV